MSDQFQLDLGINQDTREAKRREMGGLPWRQLQFICPECQHHAQMQTLHAGTIILRCVKCYAAMEPVPRWQWIQSLRAQDEAHNRALEEIRRLRQPLRRKKPSGRA
jgi:hypothetical protein